MLFSIDNSITFSALSEVLTSSCCLGINYISSGIITAFFIISLIISWITVMIVLSSVLLTVSSSSFLLVIWLSSIIAAPENLLSFYMGISRFSIFICFSLNKFSNSLFRIFKISSLLVLFLDPISSFFSCYYFSSGSIFSFSFDIKVFDDTDSSN